MKWLAPFICLLLIPFTGISQDTIKPPAAFGITVSLPWVNNYAYYNYESNKRATKSGFVGLGASAFYKTGDHKFSLNYGFTGDLPVPMGAFDYGKEGTRTNIRAWFWEALYHRSIFERVNIITGLNYVKYRFTFSSYVDMIPSYTIDDPTIGVTLGAEYTYMKHSTIAVFYRPNLVSFDKKQYRHIISADARFDIYLWRRK